MDVTKMEPKIIKKLEENVINRIAAGEIIQRPANAIKELIENSLDAKATSVQVLVKQGGLKLIQIQDNGTGIRREDLEIVCVRFTTSKLSKYEELSNIETFGFRGEALASMSHVAHLSIQTKTAKDVCGYKAFFEDGILKDKPKPCASNQGTIISIEDIFYNMPQRLQCLKSSAEEFQKICDVVSKYAIHNSKVAFLLKKVGSQPTFKTNVNSTRKENIRLIYGSQIENNLIEMKFNNNKYANLEVEGFITSVNNSAKKMIFLLFINHRLVDCPGLRAAIDEVYSTYLPKGAHPFVYIGLVIEPTAIDVNIHPTKHEVHFLYENEIIDLIKSQIELRILGSNTTRSLYKQLKLPGAVTSDVKETKINSENVHEKDMIRTDSKEQKIEKFLGNYSAFKEPSESRKSLMKVYIREVRLTSILNMRKRIESNCCTSLRKTIREMVFVGVVGHSLALVQFEKSLFLCNTFKYSLELFYQRLIYRFQNFRVIKIEPKLCVRDLIRIGLNSEESGWSCKDGNKDDLAAQAVSILKSKSPLLRQYFALSINENNELESLPELLRNHSPCSIFLPNYMLRLATEVRWESEEECFETFARETAFFYSRVSFAEFETQKQELKLLIEHNLYAAFKQYLLPPKNLNTYIYELTNLPKLYKVFERC